MATKWDKSLSSSSEKAITLPGRVFNKINRTIKGIQPVQRNWEVQFLSTDGKRHLAQRLLEPGKRVHEFVDVSSIRDLLDRFYIAPDAGNGYAVSMILTVSTWLEITRK